MAKFKPSVKKEKESFRGLRSRQCFENLLRVVSLAQFQPFQVALQITYSQRGRVQGYSNSFRNFVSSYFPSQLQGLSIVQEPVNGEVK